MHLIISLYVNFIRVITIHYFIKLQCLKVRGNLRSNYHVVDIECVQYHAGRVQRAAMCAHFKMAATRGLSATGCDAHDAARALFQLIFFIRARGWWWRGGGSLTSRRRTAWGRSRKTPRNVFPQIYLFVFPCSFNIDFVLFLQLTSNL